MLLTCPFIENLGIIHIYIESIGHQNGGAVFPGWYRQSNSHKFSVYLIVSRCPICGSNLVGGLSLSKKYGSQLG